MEHRVVAVGDHPGVLVGQGPYTFVEPAVRIELTTARLHGGSAPIRGYPPVFASASQWSCNQVERIRSRSRVPVGVARLLTGSCDTLVTPKILPQNAEGPGDATQPLRG